MVSTHSRPKAAAIFQIFSSFCLLVSTHSRPKAAACDRIEKAWGIHSFNTQPPEGGCC